MSYNENPYSIQAKVHQGLRCIGFILTINNGIVLYSIHLGLEN